MRFFKRHKFNAKPQVVDGHRFASKAEARRYVELRTLALAGEIKNLCLQPRFPIHVNNTHICDYVADFEYESEGKRVVEDVKGVQTPVFILKRKLFEVLYGMRLLVS